MNSTMGGDLSGAVLQNVTQFGRGALAGEVVEPRTHLVTAVHLAALPAVVMAFGSALVCCTAPTQSTQARFQKLSAGLLIGAAIIDIFPLVKRQLYTDDSMTQGNPGALAAAFLGFASAMLLMYGIKCLELGGDESDSEDSGDEEAKKSPLRSSGDATQASEHSASSSLPNLVEDSEADSEDSIAVRRSGTQLRSDSGPLFRRWNTQGLPENVFDDAVSVRQTNATSNSGQSERTNSRKRIVTSHIPWGLIVAVVVDSCVDGMLVGLAASASWGSGLLLSTATAIEMGFLGFSFAIAVLSAARRRWAIVIIAIPPLALLGAASGARAFIGIIKDSIVFEGVLAFSLVAVLFMVFEELLVEANESGGGDWHIGIFLYLGLALSIALDFLIG